MARVATGFSNLNSRKYSQFLQNSRNGPVFCPPTTTVVFSWLILAQFYGDLLSDNILFAVIYYIVQAQV